MQPQLAFVVAILALAAIAEGLTEYIFGEWVQRWTKYIALAVGVLLAINFQLDLFAMLFGLKSTIPLAGIVLTGVLLGRGSNFIHDFVSRFLPGTEQPVLRRYKRQ